MSIAEIERFAADLKSNEALRGEAAKAQAETSPATPMARVVAFAATNGYAFTADDLTEYAKARELTDAELVGVAGGIDSTPIDNDRSDRKKFLDAWRREFAVEMVNDQAASLEKMKNIRKQSEGDR